MGDGQDTLTKTVSHPRSTLAIMHHCSNNISTYRYEDNKCFCQDIEMCMFYAVTKAFDVTVAVRWSIVATVIFRASKHEFTCFCRHFGVSIATTTVATPLILHRGTSGTHKQYVGVSAALVRPRHFFLIMHHQICHSIEPRNSTRRSIEHDTAHCDPTSYSSPVAPQQLWHITSIYFIVL